MCIRDRGVLPFKFEGKDNRKSLGFSGSETINILDIEENLIPQGLYTAEVMYSNGKTKTVKIRLLVNTVTEIEYLETGGILQYVFKNLVNSWVKFYWKLDKNAKSLPLPKIVDRIALNISSDKAVKLS